jgi:hypothetical protein
MLAGGVIAASCDVKHCDPIPPMASEDLSKTFFYACCSLFRSKWRPAGGTQFIEVELLLLLLLHHTLGLEVVLVTITSQILLPPT